MREQTVRIPKTDSNLLNFQCITSANEEVQTSHSLVWIPWFTLHSRPLSNIIQTTDMLILAKL